MLFAEKVKILKEYAQEHNLGLEDIAESTGLERKQVYNIITRDYESEIRSDFWYKMGVIIGVNFDEDLVYKKEEVKIPEYIIPKLKLYGNTIIGRKFIKRYKIEGILEYLHDNGLDCEIKEIEHDYGVNTFLLNVKKMGDNNGTK